MKTSGNTVLITGGATGIGLALARALAAEGNAVAICGRRRARLLTAKRSVPGLHIKACDVSAPASRRSLLSWMERRLPPLDVLVNNAGVQHPVDLLRGTRDLPLADEEIRTNLMAPIHLTAMLLPALRKRPDAAIVNISSGLGFTPLAVVPVYSATKAAIHSFTMCLRHQLRASRVRVFEVIPPIVATGLSGTRRRPHGKEYAMTPEDVARGIMNAIAADTYEVALGPASNLHARRDGLFDMINEANEEGP